MSEFVYERHECPWPGCPRKVLPWFWGCSEHWNMLPAMLREDFLTTRQRDAAVQPLNHQMAIERIRNWLLEHADELRESTGTQDIDEEFTAGYTPNGSVVLFWPLVGEYLVLTRRETLAMRRLFGRMLPPGPARSDGT